MKKILLLLIAVVVAPAYSEDFEKFQSNLRLRTGNYGLEIREEINSNKDHLQLSYFGIKDTEIRLRYVDNIGNKEFRPQISYFLYRGDIFFFRPRLDYRYFQGNNPDYFSFRTSFGSRHKVSQNLNFWTEVNPIWDFGIDKTSDTNLDKAQFRLGVDYGLKDLKISPFVQYETNGHFDHTDTFLGATVGLDFK